jgi:hypothetical protein
VKPPGFAVKKVIEALYASKAANSSLENRTLRIQQRPFVLCKSADERYRKKLWTPATTMKAPYFL